MTIDKEASYYDLDIHNVGIVETDQLVRCILERAGLTAHSSHRLGVLIERIARLGAKPGADVQREVGKIAIEAGMLRDSVLWDQPLSEVLAELREIHKRSEWAQMDDPVGELMRMRHGDDQEPDVSDVPATDSVSPDPAARIAELEHKLAAQQMSYESQQIDHLARIAELERELEQSEARADARLRNMESARDRIAELERERDEAREEIFAENERHALTVQESNRWRQTAERAEADLAALRKTLETEREDHVARAAELERVRVELAKTQEMRDANRSKMQSFYRQLQETEAALLAERVKLAEYEDRYRPRRQGDESMPNGSVLVWARNRWRDEMGAYLTSPDIIWTHQPPAPGEGE